MLLLQACNNNHNTSAKEEERKFPVYTLQQSDTSLDIQYVADIQACRNIEIRSRLSGILSEISVDEGQPVKKGQLLFRINDREMLIAANKASAALQSLEAERDVIAVEIRRTTALVQKKIIAHSELELQQAKMNAQQAKIQEAKASLEAARTQLSYAAIYAPFDGIIDRLPVKEGSLVDEGALLTTLSNLSKVYAYFTLSESEYITQLRHAAKDKPFGDASLVLADGTTYPFKGEVAPAESEIDENTGAIAFRATFDNPGHLLRHGATGTVVIRRSAQQVLLVPQRSVFEIQDKSYVYLVDDSSKVRMRNIVPKQRVGNFYIVESGLKTNDRIVYEGVQKLQDGDRIGAREARL